MRSRLLLVVGVLVVLSSSATLGGWAVAAGVIGAGGEITGCYNAGGQLRVVSDPSECRKGEKALAWHQVADHSCPEGQFVTGFAADGALQCAAPPAAEDPDPGCPPGTFPFGDQCLDRDADGDGHEWFPLGEDCDDEDPAVNPDATEVEDGVDNDCDGDVDESSGGGGGGGGGGGDVDADGDGFDSGADCDDEDPAVNPGATEEFNNRDDDCDGATDEGFDAGTPCRLPDGELGVQDGVGNCVSLD